MKQKIKYKREEFERLTEQTDILAKRIKVQQKEIFRLNKIKLGLKRELLKKVSKYE